MKFIIFMLVCQFGQILVHGNQEWVPYITEEEFAAIHGSPIPLVNISHHSRPAIPNGEMSSPQSRPAFANNIWTNGRIPYILDDSLTSDDRKQVAMAIQEYHDKTCIRFVPQQSSDISWVRIEHDSDSSTCGYSQPCMQSSGESYAKFGGTCLTAGVMVHELGHILCMFHEQARADRDDWITFNTSVCTPDTKYPFTLGLDKLYDYVSVEHYEDECYNGCIIPTEPGVTKCGSGGTLSVLDAEILNEVYNCTSGCQGIRWANLDKGLDYAIVTGAEADGTDLYACRAYHQGDIIPGKYNDKIQACFVSWGQEEYKKTGKYIEILHNANGANLIWIKDTSEIPSNAIKGGRSNERETIYVIKCLLNINGTVLDTPGKFHGKAYAPYGGVEYECGDDYYFLGCS